MSFVKRGDIKILDIKKEEDAWPKLSDEETELALEAAKQDIKNISKDGNKSVIAGNKNE